MDVPDNLKGLNIKIKMKNNLNIKCYINLSGIIGCSGKCQWFALL